MTIDRDELVDLLAAYASDALDEPMRDAVETALQEHPDLEGEVDRLHAALAPLGQLTSEQPPFELAGRVLDRALVTRAAGRPADADPSATAAETCRVVVHDLRALLAEVTAEESTATTPYRSSVAALVAHLAAGEQMVHRLLDGELDADDGPGGHLALGGPEHGATMAAATRLWTERAEETVRRAAGLDGAALAAPVTMHGIDLTVERMLVVRSFELWSHTEDIRRATGRSVPAIPGPVVHTMATHAIDLLGAVLAAVPGTENKSFRVTLTGVGAGSWPRRVGGGVVGVAESTDATVVADAIEFCRLFADRADPDDLATIRLGDDALCDALLATAPTFADYGERIDAD